MRIPATISIVLFLICLSILNVEAVALPSSFNGLAFRNASMKARVRSLLDSRLNPRLAQRSAVPIAKASIFARPQKRDLSTSSLPDEDGISESTPRLKPRFLSPITKIFARANEEPYRTYYCSPHPAPPANDPNGYVHNFDYCRVGEICCKNAPTCCPMVVPKEIKGTSVVFEYLNWYRPYCSPDGLKCCNKPCRYDTGQGKYVYV